MHSILGFVLRNYLKMGLEYIPGSSVIFPNLSVRSHIVGVLVAKCLGNVEGVSLVKTLQSPVKR